ncbi:uncharacterized [Tachysurus ichikawai]
MSVQQPAQNLHPDVHSFISRAVSWLLELDGFQQERRYFGTQPHKPASGISHHTAEEKPEIVYGVIAIVSCPYVTPELLHKNMMSTVVSVVVVVVVEHEGDGSGPQAPLMIELFQIFHRDKGSASERTSPPLFETSRSYTASSFQQNKTVPAEAQLTRWRKISAENIPECSGGAKCSSKPREVL